MADETNLQREEVKRVVDYRLLENEKDIDRLGTKINESYEKLEKKIDLVQNKLETKLDDELKWVRRGQWGTTISFLCLTASVVGLLIR